jgi:hypothetical protein
MPLIKPINDEDHAALEVLQASGVIPSREKNGKKKSISEILDSRGITLERVADEFERDLSSDDKTVHKEAVKLGFQLHGALKESERPTVPEINIIINGGSQQQGNVISILTPREFHDEISS